METSVIYIDKGCFLRSYHIWVEWTRVSGYYNLYMTHFFSLLIHSHTCIHAYTCIIISLSLYIQYASKKTSHKRSVQRTTRSRSVSVHFPFNTRSTSLQSPCAFRSIFVPVSIRVYPFRVSFCLGVKSKCLLNEPCKRQFFSG